MDKERKIEGQNLICNKAEGCEEKSDSGCTHRQNHQWTWECEGSCKWGNRGGECVPIEKGGNFEELEKTVENWRRVKNND